MENPDNVEFELSNPPSLSHVRMIVDGCIVGNIFKMQKVPYSTQESRPRGTPYDPWKYRFYPTTCRENPYFTEDDFLERVSFRVLKEALLQRVLLKMEMRQDGK